MPFSARCRYCGRTLVTVTDQLGDHEAASIRGHLAGCTPNVQRWPLTIGELLQHLTVSIVAPRPTVEFERLTAPSRHDVELRRDVLLVHDDEATRARMSTRLVAEGFSTAIVANAVEALRRLHAGIEPCAIVVDAELHGLGAWPLAAWLTHHPHYARLPIIVLAHARPGAWTAPVRVAAIVPDPLDHDALVATVARYCRRVH